MKAVLVVTIFAVNNGWVDLKNSNTTQRNFDSMEACEQYRRTVVVPKLNAEKSTQYAATCKVRWEQ